MDNPYKTGFPTFGDPSDSDILVSEELTSDVGSGVVIGSGSTITENGIALNGGALNFTSSLTTAQKTALERGFTMTAWVEAGWIDGTVGTGYDPAGTEYLFGCYDSQWWGLHKSSPIMRLRHISAFGGDTGAKAARVHIANKGAHVRVDWSYLSGRTTVYVDYLPVFQQTFGLPSATPFDGFIGIGGTQFGSGIITHRVKNYQLSTRPIIIPVHYGIEHIAAIGHSFDQTGDYPGLDDAAVPLDFAGDLGGDTGEERTWPAVHRALHKHGIGVPQRIIRNVAVGGESLVDLSAHIDNLQTLSSVTPVVFCQIGTNDIRPTSAWPVAYPSRAQWKAGLKVEVNRLVAAGTRIFIMGEMVSVQSELASVGNTVVEGLTVEINEVFAEVATEITEFHVVQLYQDFGADNPPTDGSGLYLVNNIHPNDQGYTHIGNKFANKAIELL